MISRGEGAERAYRFPPATEPRCGVEPHLNMSFARFSLSVAGIVGVVAVALAAATIWLMMTQPVTVADAVASGEVSPLVKALAGVLYDAFRGIIKYL